MKKIFGFLICTLLISVRVYAEADIPTDKSYTFDRANVASVLAEFIEDEKKAQAAADKYNELSNNIENAISAVDFVDVCVAGGMNMKLVDGSGYMKCLDMFMKLIEMQNLDAGGFDMYCPATGNALKSITDKTQVGDVCGGTSDTYIEYGYVTLKTDDKNGQHKYVCTCTPQSCKDGYYWNKEKHQCSVKDKDGYCVRHILGSFEYKKDKFPTSGVGINDRLKKSNAYYNDKYAQMNASFDAFSRCVEYGANQGCRIRGALASVDFGNKYRVICNPANYEIAADKKIQEDKEKKHKAELAENMTYYEVCGKDKGKGKCVDDVFTNIVVGGTQVDPRGAAFLAEEYARVHFNDEIKCKADKEGIRRVWTDYFIKCRSVKDLSKYYEFKFDDAKESFDNVVRRNVDRAICEKIYGFKLNGNICETSEENCTGKIIPAYERYYGDGRAHAYYGWDRFAVIPDYTSKCRINHTPLFENSKLSNDFGDKLDNYAFCKNTYNQLRNDDNLINLIKKYMASQLGIKEYQIECVPASKKWPGGCSAESQNMMEFATNPSDNLISCHVGDKWVDFVFDDTRELSNKLSEVSMDAMQCVIHGHELSVKLGTELNAKNKGKKCTGLTKELCTDLDKMIRNRGGSGADYDNKKMACIINSAKEYSTQEFWTNMGISAVVAVGSAVMVIGSGGVATPLVVGGATMLIETGINGSFYIVEESEAGQAGHRFRKFIDAAKKCKDSTCAQNVIKNHYNDLASVKEDYNYEDAAELQKELDRLFGLMEGDFCWQDQNGNILNPDSNGKCDKLVAIIHLDAEDKSLQRASIGLMIGVFVFDPESVMMKLASKGEKLLRMFRRSEEIAETEIRIGKTLDNMFGQKFTNAIQHIKKTPTSKKVVVGLIDERKFVAQIDIEDYIQTLRQQGYDIEVIETYTALDTKKFGQNITETKNYKAAEAASQSEFRIFRISTNTESTDMAQIDMDFINHASDIDKNYRQGFVAQKYRKIAVEDEDSWYNTYKTILEEYSSKDADILYAKEHWKDMDIEAKKHFIEETNQKFRNLICEDPKSCTINWGAAEELGGDASYDPQRLGSSALSESDIQSDTYAYSIPHHRSTFENTLLNIIHENLHYGQDIGKTDMPKYLLDHNTDNYILPRDIPGIETYGFSKPAYTLQPLEIEAKVADHKILQGILEHMEK